MKMTFISCKYHATANQISNAKKVINHFLSNGIKVSDLPNRSAKIGRTIYELKEYNVFANTISVKVKWNEVWCGIHSEHSEIIILKLEEK